MENVIPGVLQRLRAADIIRMAGLTTASLGQEYNRIATLKDMQRRGARLRGSVELPSITDTLASAFDGNSPASHSYTTEVELLDATSWRSTCSCNRQNSLLCSHGAALLYRWLAQPELFEAPVGTAETPATMPPRKAPFSASQPSPMRISVRSEENLPESIALVHYSPDLLAILSQLSLGELRNTAREYELLTNGTSKQQLAELIVEAIKQPDVVRHVASTLEKAQRQLLSALLLAGGGISDDDLQGLFERFSLGQPAQLQQALLALQRKALLFRVNHSSIDAGLAHSRALNNGNLLASDWFVPAEVRNALHVLIPSTSFDIAQPDEKYGTLQTKCAQPYHILADLLLVARVLDGMQVAENDPWSPQRSAEPPSFPTTAGRTENSFLIVRSADIPSTMLLEALQKELPFSWRFLSFAVRLLCLAGIVQKPERASPFFRTLPDAAQLLLGSTPSAVLRDLFTLWRQHVSSAELFEFLEHGLQLRCRMTPLNVPVLSMDELAGENTEARQAIINLLTQAPLQKWMHFAAFARFVSRLNPLFLQRRQRVLQPPHWWLEAEPGKPLKPLKLSDWQRAELHYLAYLLTGPLHWWGLCDVVLSEQGDLLAFRMTDLAAWLFQAAGVTGELNAEIPASDDEIVQQIQVLENGTLLIPCSAQYWPVIELLESFAEAVGVKQERLCYRFTPLALSEALSRGQRPDALLAWLSKCAVQEMQDVERCKQLLLRLEQWLASYGRVRIYSDVTLLETIDPAAMRELAAITPLDTQVIRSLHPTLLVLRKSAIERLVDDLKRRGQSPLIHEEEV